MTLLDELVAALRPAWMADAACRGMDVNLWFPERGGVSTARDAKAICAGCPVLSECLEQETGERHGIRGGLTPRQRQRLARDRLPTSAVVVCEPVPTAVVEPVIVRMRREFVAAL